ncbi:MAG: X2-like carbohydrate binding domain-containing protein [Syntrophomonas sp.]
MHDTFKEKPIFFHCFYLLILVILLGLIQVTPVMAQSQTNNTLLWKWCNPLPIGNRLNSVVYGADRLMAVGNSGAILSSPDGKVWTEQESGIMNDLNDILWNGSQFVAIGYSGEIITSPDGKVWTKQNSGTTACLCCVAWDGNKYVVCGDSGVILTSINGISWNQLSSKTDVLPTSVTYGGGKFVAVGYYGEIMTSTDGITWTKTTLPEGEDLYEVTWDGHQFAAVSYSSVFTSLDGTTWTRRISDVYGLFSIAWNGSKFVALGLGGVMVTSPNGTDWTAPSIERVGNDSVYDVTWDGTQFVAVGGCGTILTSIDGCSWTPQCSTITKSSLEDVANGNGQFAAVGYSGTIVTSTDYNSWNLQNSGTSKNLFGIIYTGNQFVAVGDNGTILTSPDGCAWTTQSSGTTDVLWGVAWNGNVLVAVGGNGTILTSANGTNWTKQTFGTEFLKDVIWGGNQFVAVGVRGMMLTSPDGSTWTQVNPGTSQWLSGITCNGSQFVVVGDSGIVLTSPNGNTWTPQNSTITYQCLQDVTWNGEQFIAVGTFGVILTSIDGCTWTQQKVGSELRGVATNGTQVLVVGDSGSILQSQIASVPYSTISPSTAVFDRNTSNQTDIPVTVNFNGNTLISITNGNVPLNEGTDFTVNGNIYILKKEYLAQQAIGTTLLTFSFNSGTAKYMDITVTESTSKPVLQSISGGRTRVILIYDKPLNPDVVPSVNDFTVTAGGTEKNIQSIDIIDTQVILYLSDEIYTRDATADYIPGNYPLQDQSGNLAAEFYAQPVNIDTKSPILSAMDLQVNKLVLTYDVQLDSTSIPVPGDYTVKMNSLVQTINTVEVSGNQVVLTMNNNFDPAQLVTIYYTAGSNPVRNLIGNEAPGLYNMEVNPSQLKCISANAYNQQISIKYNTLLDRTSIPATSDFTVNIDSVKVDVNEIYFSEESIILWLPQEVVGGQEITLSYTPGLNHIKSSAGLQAEALSGLAVENIENHQPPRVTLTSPGNGVINVGVDSVVTVTYNNKIAATDTTGEINISDSIGTIPITYSIAGTTITLTPLQNLNYKTVYTVTIPRYSLQNTFGTEIYSDYSFSFTTVAGETIAPVWPAGSTLSAAQVSDRSLDLNWTPAVDNVGVTKYRIYKNGGLICTVGGETKFRVNNLVHETQYTFKIEAGDRANNWTSNGPALTVSTEQFGDSIFATDCGSVYFTHTGGSWVWGANMEVVTGSTWTCTFMGRTVVPNDQFSDGTSSINMRMPAAVDLGDIMGVTTNGGWYVLKRDGTVWEQQNYGKQLSQLLGLSNIVDIDGNLALDDYGNVWNYSWGVSQVSGISDVVDVTDGFALKNDGTIWFNLSSYDYPDQYKYLRDVVAVDSWNNNYSTSCLALCNDGSVWIITDEYSPPQKIPGISNVTAVQAGDGYFIMLKDDGTVWAYGQNGYGQIGDGTLIDRNTPVKVKDLSDVKQIGTSGIHTLAFRGDSTVWAWGKDYFKCGGNLKAGPITIPINCFVNYNPASEDHGFPLIDPSSRELNSFYAEPIDTATGGHVLERTLLAENGLQPLLLTARYDSMLLADGPLGKGWGHNYETYLENLQDGSIKIHWNANRYNTFANAVDNQYTSEDRATRNDSLLKNEDGTYTLIRKDQSVYNFDSAGKLVKQKNRQGQDIDLSYNQNNQLVQITEPVSGVFVNIHYNEAGEIAKMVDGLGREVNMSYDINHNLIGITDTMGQCIDYTYDNTGRVLTATNTVTGNQEFSDTYDANGRVITQDDAILDNLITHFAYDTVTQPGRIVNTITDRNGKNRTFIHDNNYQLLEMIDGNSNTTEYDYDADGNKTKVTDENGNTTNYTYDESGNILSSMDADGNKTSMTYDERNNLLSITDALGHTTSFSYDSKNNLLSAMDAAGKVTSFSYDSNSQMVSRTLPDQGTSQYTYTNGMLSTAIDPAGVTINYTYDAAGRVTSISDEEGNKTTITYDAQDRPLTITDPLGCTLSYSYDSYGNKTSETDGNGNTTSYTYNNDHKMTSQKDAFGNVTNYGYDGEDRLISTTDPLGHTTTLSYDPAGRLISITDALSNTVSNSYDPAGNLIGIKNSDDVTILSQAFNNLNLPTSITDALGNATTKSYDNLRQVTSIADPKGQVSNYSYDQLNHLTSGTDPLSGTSRQEFDAAGNLLSIADPNGNQQSFTYDNAGRIVSQKDGSNNTITYAYNKLGQIATKTNGRGQTASFSYDKTGRIIAMNTPEGDTISYSYDNNGNLMAISDSSGTISRSYDALNRVTSYRDVNGNTISYQYDAVGNLTGLTYPDGKTVCYSYDAVNRLTGVRDWAGRETTYGYDTDGRLVTTARPDGSIETRSYDAAGELTQLKDQDAKADTVSQYDFAYDANGNVVSETSAGIFVPYSEGNKTMTYGAGNKLETYNEESVAYDADGNMTTGPLKDKLSDFNYDSRNRLTKGGDISYSYDPENNRTSQEKETVATNYVVNPQASLSQILQMKKGSNTSYCVYGLGLLGIEDADGNYQAYHYDRRGSTVAITNMTGAITDTFSYGPYGELANHSGGTDTPFLYNGKDSVMTDANGLYYMRARYYQPEIKRFINQDVLLGNITDSKTLNRYAYVNGQPVNLVDPWGLEAQSSTSSVYSAGSGISSNINNREFGNVSTEITTTKQDWLGYTGISGRYSGQLFGNFQGEGNFTLGAVVEHDEDFDTLKIGAGITPLNIAYKDGYQGDYTNVSWNAGVWSPGSLGGALSFSTSNQEAANRGIIGVKMGGDIFGVKAGFSYQFNVGRFFRDMFK